MRTAVEIRTIPTEEAGRLGDRQRFLKVGARIDTGTTVVNGKGRRAKSERHETAQVEPWRLRIAIKDLGIVTEDGEPNRRAVAALLGLKDRRTVKRWIAEDGQRMSYYWWRILEAMKWRLIAERQQGKIGARVTTADCEHLRGAYLAEVKEEVDRAEALTAHTDPFKHR